MRYENRELLERLAADYAVGALRGPARRRFERLIAGDATLALLVDGWSARLDTLAESAPRIEPPAAAWAAIEARIAREAAAAPVAGAPPSLWRFLFGKPAFALPRLGTVGLWYCVGFWRAVGLAGIAAVLALFLFIATAPEFGASQTTHIAVLSDNAAKPVLVANLDAATGTVRIKAVDLAPPATDKSFELWLVPPDGTAPRSLGVIEGDSYETELGAADFADLRKGALAVSLEPAGGSPTGQVTGPVLYVGPVLPAS